MKVHSPYRCDYCLNLKGETNHWWLRPPDRQFFTVLRWDATLAGTEGYEHICSESCAAKALSKWMTQPSAHIRHAASMPFAAPADNKVGKCTPVQV
jgi:hypothetical protein